MLGKMYEVKYDPYYNKPCIVPVGPQGNTLPFIVVFESEYKAKKACALMAMGLLPTPEVSPQSYEPLGLYNDDETKAYKLKQSVKF